MVVVFRAIALGDVGGFSRLVSTSGLWFDVSYSDEQLYQI